MRCIKHRNEKGELHRIDGPAIIWDDGAQEWYRNGKLHRIGGPAVFCKNGTQVWYKNGKLHRIDGPAILYPDGCESWYQNGKRHRENGPAVVYYDEKMEWWRNGVEYELKQEYDQVETKCECLNNCSRDAVLTDLVGHHEDCEFFRPRLIVMLKEHRQMKFQAKGE